MRVAAVLVLLLVSHPLGAEEVARAGPYTFHSSFWINLHEMLMHCATASCDMAPLSDAEKTEWNAAVDAYRKAAEGSPTIMFVRPMRITRDALSQVADDLRTPELRPPLGEALLRAEPVYRRHFWAGHDRSNRFWIAYAAPMIRDAGEELARAHEKAYSMPWPAAVRVDASRYAGRFGAYTLTGRVAGVHESIAVAEEGNYGVEAIETIVHEASHGIIGRDSGTVAEAIGKHAQRLGIEPPRDLWHAILFATSSELTRRALLRRGIRDYKPHVYEFGLYDRVWPRYRKPIEEHWIAYLDGRITFDEAIGRIVEAAPAPE